DHDERAAVRSVRRRWRTRASPYHRRLSPRARDQELGCVPVNPGAQTITSDFSGASHQLSAAEHVETGFPCGDAARIPTCATNSPTADGLCLECASWLSG